ncbi:ead/Ea22-like family protein [Klebsiella pneumoniae]
MTTDITELAQSLKAAAEKASNGDWVKESGDGWEACCSANDQANGGFIIAHFVGPDAAENREFVQAANPANVLALVEALGKAQQQIIALQQRHEVDPRTHEIIDLKEHIDNLESFRTAYMEWGEKTDWMQTDKRFDFLKPWGKHRADVLKAYIEHLESHIVKLPKPYAYLRENDGQIQISIGSERPSDRSGGYATPWFAIYTAVGIKVEAE